MTAVSFHVILCLTNNATHPVDCRQSFVFCWLQVTVHPEGLATRHLDTGFPWFYSVLQQMLSRYPKSTLHCIHLTLPSNTHSSSNALTPSLCVTLPSPNFPALYSICRLLEREGRAGTGKNLQNSTFCILPPSVFLSRSDTTRSHSQRSQSHRSAQRAATR